MSYRGRDISRLPVHKRTALGIGRTFQNVGLVKNVTVLENLRTAQHLQVGYEPVAGMLGLPATYDEERRIGHRGEQILDLLELADGRRRRGSPTCPTALLKRVEIAAVLATDPDLLLLDEPGSGHGSRGGARSSATCCWRCAGSSR